MRKLRLRDYRAIATSVAVVVLGLAATSAMTSGVGFFLDPDPTGPLALGASSGVTAAIGGMLYVIGRKHETKSLSRREATVAVVAIWVAACVAGALPLWIGSDMSLIDAIFEAASGLTTTGATVLEGIDDRRPSLLLWRSLIQWLGGMGIVVLFVAVFPSLGVGAKHMVRGEVPGTSSKGLKPRIRETAFILWRLYVLFTGVITLVYWALGMSPFDAVCHALTTISTGGFSTHDASLGWFDSPAIYVAASIFMLGGSVSYGLYFATLRFRSGKALWKDTELRVFLALSALCFVGLFIPLVAYHGGHVGDAAVDALFVVGTTLSSTGYGIHDTSTYSSPALTVVLVMMFVGGCAGSTAGGIKVERIVLVAKQAVRQLERFTRPRVVRVLRMGDRPVDDTVLDDVAAFLTVFAGSLAIGTFALAALEGLPVPTAFGAILTCLSNMGPAPFHVGPDNFVAYSPVAKLLCAVAMVLGRLEFFTVLALLSKDVWRR